MKLRYGLTVFLIFSLLSALVSGFFLYQVYHQPVLVASDSIFVLEHNSSAKDFALKLADDQRIKYPLAFYYLLRANGRASQLKAGVYRLYPGDTLDSLLARVLRGEVARFSFTVIAGTTWQTIQEKLKKAPWLQYDAEELTQLFSSYGFCSSLSPGSVACSQLPCDPSRTPEFSAQAEERKGCVVTLHDNKSRPLLQDPANRHERSDAAIYPEGLLLAETYAYSANDTAAALVQRAIAALNSVVEKNWRQRADDLPYITPYELLTAASIIEKETARAEERSLIASVIVNRLRKNMRLQMDPTVIYAMGENWGGTLSKTDLRIDSPYNTYRYRGLPPAPIAMVSRAAIEAAALPAHTSFLYFVARGDGSHQFSVRYEDQQAAVNQYIRRRQADE